MRILVTGGAGFIGKNLCRELLTQGYTVVSVDNLITGDTRGMHELSAYKNFTFIKHDIVRPLPRAVYGIKFDCVYHLACPTGVPNVTKLGEEMLLTSSIGTKRILDLAKTSGAHFVFTSSSEVYGNPLVTPQREEYTGNVDPVGVRSTYEEGKRFAESLVVWYVRRYNLRAMIVRLFNTYGPGMSVKDTRVVPTFIRQAKNDMALTIQGKGLQKRTFCYVDDTVSAIMTVMDKGLPGEVYNIGGTDMVTMNDLARLVKEIAHSRSPITHIKRPDHDHEHRLPDVSKLKHLGWKPRVPLSEGLSITLKGI
jgi:nucleoside-diphosphate-sugar epimerase